MFKDVILVEKERNPMAAWPVGGIFTIRIRYIEEVHFKNQPSYKALVPRLFLGPYAQKYQVPRPCCRAGTKM